MLWLLADLRIYGFLRLRRCSFFPAPPVYSHFRPLIMPPDRPAPPHDMSICYIVVHLLILLMECLIAHSAHHTI